MATPKQAVLVEDGAVFVLQAGTRIFIKTAEVCALTGKSNQWIGQLTSQGILNKSATAHGSLYDVRDTVKNYLAMIEQKSEAANSTTAENEAKKLEAEVAIKKSKAIVAALEAKELQGKMHRSEDVAAMTEDLVYTIRSALLSLPGRCAVDTANTSDAAETAEIIRTEIFSVMEELSHYEYDPAKYQECVRERRKWERLGDGDNDDVVD